MLPSNLIKLLQGLYFPTILYDCFTPSFLPSNLFHFSSFASYSIEAKLSASASPYFLLISMKEDQHLRSALGFHLLLPVQRLYSCSYCPNPTLQHSPPHHVTYFMKTPCWLWDTMMNKTSFVSCGSLRQIPRYLAGRPCDWRLSLENVQISM